MTDLFFTVVFLAGMGFFFGKLLKGLNPFKVILGLFFLLIPAVAFLAKIDNYWFTASFVIGFLLNFKGGSKSGGGGIFESIETWWLYRKATKYDDSLQKEKADIEDDLRKQKSEAEDDLKNQRQRAEDELNNKARQAQDHFRQEAENLKRERERFEEELNKADQNTEFKDTRTSEEVLGLSGDYTLEDLKKAYKVRCKLHHPDKYAGSPEHIQKMNADEMIAVNEANRRLMKGF